LILHGLRVATYNQILMKVLSLLQPWATLVIMGVKQVETRSWSTSYRGPLLIHASKGRAGENLCDEPRFKKYIPDFKQLPFGYIIGKVNLTDVIRIDSGGPGTNDERINKLTTEEKGFGDYSPGRYAWILHDPIAFKTPVGAQGSLSLWEFNEGLIDEKLD